MTLPALSVSRARALVSRFAGVPVLVVGDLMLDRFIVGKVSRISPEAPVPVVRYDREYTRLGGAANVAHNLAALGARVALVGVVGADRTGAQLREALAESGIGTAGLVVDPGRPTVEKVRVVTDRKQQVARIDYEDDSDVSPAVATELARNIAHHGSGARALLVSDYLKGTINQAVMAHLVALKGHDVPLIVDPKIPNLHCYGRATLVTPNHHEAETATHLRIRDDDEARKAAIDFRVRASCDAALITRGEHGMWLSSSDAEGAIASVAREVSDVTGAGDTVAATLAVALAAGATLAEAARLANHAAGIVVGKFGPATVSPDELLSAF